MRVLVTISRSWRQWSRVRSILTAVYERHPDAVLVHGNAEKGDQTLAGIWRSLGGVDDTMPADWATCDPESDVACRRPHRRTRGNGRDGTRSGVGVHPKQVTWRNGLHDESCGGELERGSAVPRRGDRVSEKPKRIQRKRTAGWRMPANTVYVGRGTKWGNPYRVTERVTPEQAVASYDVGVRGGFDYIPGPDEIRCELAGKNLACWCPNGQACHADLLLAIANREEA